MYELPRGASTLSAGKLQWRRVFRASTSGGSNHPKTRGYMSESQRLVCVVDDDFSTRRGLRRLLKSAGYDAEMFASSEDYLARETFDGPICLVLDVRMPGLNGLDLQKTLEARGACEQIVFITGHGDVSTCKKALKNGAIDFLNEAFRRHRIDRSDRTLARPGRKDTAYPHGTARGSQSDRKIDPARI